MYNKEEKLLTNFDQTAIAFVNKTYVEFLSSIKDVDRWKNEDTFQLWIRNYIDKLKKRLEGKALEYISINRDLPTIDWFHKKLVYMIRQYLQEFLQRTKSFRYRPLNDLN